MTPRWQEVVDNAGGRCECRGACGRKHSSDPAGRCAREGTQTAPLRAVPRQPVATRVAASLPAADLHALCGPCHETTARKQTAALAQAQRDQADTAPLF